MSRTAHAVAALLWLQARRGPESTTSVAAVLGVEPFHARRILHQLARTGAVRGVGQAHSARLGRPPTTWEAVGIEQALDEALASCAARP